MKKIKTQFDQCLRTLARNLQIKASHLTPREQRIMVMLFLLLSLLLSFYLLFQHIK